MPRNRVQHQKGLSDDAFEQRYPDEEACRKAWFAWRFNRRFVLKTIHERLAIAATTTPPMPYRLLKLAEARW